VAPLNAVGVLNVHARLTERMKNPQGVTARFIAWHLRQAVEEQWASGLMTQGTFHPVVPIGSTALPTLAMGEDMARLIGRGLGRSVTYQVTAPMVRDMRTVYETRYDPAGFEPVDMLDDKLIPSPAGFAWLDEPWRLSTVDGGFLVRALSWEFTEVWTLDDVVDPDEMARIGNPPNLWPCVRVCLWRYQPDSPDDTAPELGQVTLTHTALMPCQIRFIDPPDPAERDAANCLLALVHLLWLYLGMEISSSEKQGIPASTRKAVHKVIKRPDVRVVILRRTRPVGEGEPGHRVVRWSCRWTVDEHYRHRVRPADGHKATVAEGLDKHCATCGGALSSVRSYPKGPAGLPWRKPAPVLMKLAR